MSLVPLFLKKAGGGGQPPPSESGGLVTRYGIAPGTLSDLIRLYWPPSEWVNAASVAYLESHWRPQAVADTRGRAGGLCNQPYTLSDGRPARTEYSVGYYQINICAHGGTFAEWANPDRNVSYAAQLYRARGNYGAWFYSAGQLGLPR
jgi:hypothetical protein